MSRTPHYITSNGGKVGFIARDAYADISDIVGVVKVTSSDQLASMTDIEDLRQSGVALHFHCRVDIGGQIRTRKILCAMTKASTARAQLIGRSYAGGTIRSVSIKRDRVLY